MLGDVADGARHGRDVAAQQVQHGGLCASVSGMGQFHAAGFAQQSAHKVRGGARSRRSEVAALGIGFDPGDEVSHVFHAGRHSGPDGKAEVEHASQ